MPYIGKSPSAGVRQRYQYTATAGQTTFSGTDLGNLTLTYTDNNFVDVFQNGVLLKGGGTDYTATSGTSVVLTTGASVSDVIEIIVYDVFSVGNFYNRTDSDSRYVNVDGDTMTGSLDLNGTELILDADGDTSIDASTDDTIVFDTGGSERMRIASDGKVGVGTNSGTGKFTVQDSSLPKIQSNYQGTHHLEMGVGSSGCGFAMTTGHFMSFNHQPVSDAGTDSNLTERMRIDSGGLVLIGATSTFGNQGLLQVDATGTNKNGVNFKSDANSYAIVSCAPSQYHVYFTENCSSAVGTITSNGSSTSYNTSSDYRLKENVVTDWDATTRLKQLKPSRFNFKINKDKTVDGFLAHEVSSIVPEAVTGEKDAMTKEVLYVDEDEIPEGKKVGDVKTPSEINPQGIDQSKLVPLLVKTIQELEARITTLENA